MGDGRVWEQGRWEGVEAEIGRCGKRGDGRVWEQGRW